MDAIFWNSVSFSWDIPTRYVGPYKISHWIEKFGYLGQVIDFVKYLTEEQLYTATKKFITPQTKIIGVSTTFLTSTLERWSDGSYSFFPEHIINVTKRLKAEFPKIKFILGGYGSEFIYGYGLWDATIMSYTDATEDIFLEYLDYLNNKTAEPAFKLLTNYYMTISSTARKHYYAAKNKLYNIEIDDFKFKKSHAILPGEALPLDISRGCIFACRFCNYPHLGKTKKDYIRGMEYIKEELLHNYENFGTTNYMILDDTFNESVEKLEEFYKMTSSLPFSINYSAYLRADLIYSFPESAYLLKDSGLWGAFHGLESLHPYASKLVGKGWSGKHAKDYIPKLYHDIWGGKIPQHLNFIMGLPKETFDDIMNTVRWVEENKLYSINMERLALGNPTQTHRHSIMSEFERNSTKYGFEFVEVKNELEKLYAWKNETWDSSSDSFTDSWRKINYYIDSHKLRKHSIWSLGNLQLLGYNKSYLISTPQLNFDTKILKLKVDNAYFKYYQLLMS